ncbi:hypothetical protein ACTMU2_14265 [Cupriavidus basilensis]
MQHNDFWIRYFQRNFGITAQQIVQDRCLAIRGAGYVVRYEMNRARDFWTGVAKYHNPDPVIGYAYVLRVANAAKRFRMSDQVKSDRSAAPLFGMCILIAVALFLVPLDIPA